MAKDGEFPSEHFDVLIVGAGLSGIGAGYHLQKRCPGKRYVILENRDAIGGTWDLFRYPGIRSDSDMYTLGYAFKPWTEQKAIADGPSIWKYVNETAREYGIDKHIRFKHRVVRASWSSGEARWTVEAEHEGGVKRFTADFVLMCAGYYKYEHGYLPAFKHMDRFKGPIIQPQLWPEDLDYSGKRVVVIGSGATAVTLVPAMTDKAAHVTMLQRTPTYMISLPAVDNFGERLRRSLPAQLAYDLNRAFRTFFQQFFFRFARARPEVFKRRLFKRIEEHLPKETIEQHFTPPYKPWEQRLCLVPDNDLFEAMKAGKASVVTDHIEEFTEKGVRLKSGQELEADIIVAATGLILQTFGGAEVYVDGAKVETGKCYTYKGAMFSDVPNLISVFGYTNASWTLRADLILEYACRLINYLDEYGLASATPRLKGPVEERPFVDFSSGYFQRAKHILPKQTTRAPWKQRQSYFHDIMDLRYGAIEDGELEFKRRSEPETAAPATGDRAPALAK
jgi:cation diffusion facilitator CzcD-associated flavoprotein CzcO